MPIKLVQEAPEQLQNYLSISQLEYVQWINLIGVISICTGVFIGSGKVQFCPQRQAWSLPPFICKRLKKAAIVCGLIGVIGFAYSIYNVGGIEAAYGKSYGGGWDDSGYVREIFLLTLPALLWFLTSHMRTRLSQMDWVWVFLFLTPLLMQGLLGGRRGPTAMALIGITVGLYLIRGRRPPLTIVLVGSLLLGSLLLFIVNNRGEIYLGSDFNFQQQEQKQEYISVSSGNEYIFGASTILNADIRSEYLWGRRYFIVFFIRPIPKEVWPTKYDDATQLFGVDLRENAGISSKSIKETLGWLPAKGAAPGIIADMWLEMWWFSFIILYLIGWVYGTAWRKVLSQGGLWIPTYTLMTALSVYLVTQTLEAMGFRFLWTFTAAWLIWRYGAGKFRKTLLNQYNSDFNHQSF
ncbi:oligosaccharide repeat unit polymerase [Anabaena subtropica]|uniref:Oligosaccharide repeat unit polymerase n=1 Tax=Anabaena subtropica FACHB-260 TaxID=2692884 RepID=A0ABR8CJM0_9NOST|nr:oligosaccharide repeat unit polymerase [Anabaena subtropica]MBD2343427.1 oligosaccharide repeat unit polymerase [Anabaena subtropica FACHB-260]